MSMSSSVDLNDPMSQEASGTAWMPASNPTYAWMQMKPNGDMLMLHGAAMPRYVDVGSKRGDRRVDAPNWFMGMYSHPIGSKDQLGLRSMMSLDPITEGGYGYPLLFQTGETWHHQPLHDRQHPHDFFDELAATYSHLLGGGKSAYVYFGYPGEPALGPPTYMHRLLASDYADAPIGHHWQDATHITFGVATVGLNFSSKAKIEASSFTGREPNENRYSFDKPRFDSRSARLSYNPNPNNALQVSYGFVRNPEGDGADVHRTTASWIYNRPLGDDSNLQTALVWGQNDLSDEGKSQSYLGEVDYQRGANTVFSRIELIQKSGHELVLPAPFDTAQLYNLGEYTAGYVRDLRHGKGIDTGVGFAVTANTKPSGLEPFYGTGTPLSFEVFFRFRPSRMKMMSKMDDMTDMPMTPPHPIGPTVAPPTDETPPTTPAPQPTEPAPSTSTTAPTPTTAPAAPAENGGIDDSLYPATPKARIKNVLTLSIVDKNGTPLPGASVTGAVAMTSMDMGTTHPTFVDIGDGRYRATVQFSMAGPWRITVKATPPGGGKPMSKSFDYSVER